MENGYNEYVTFEVTTKDGTKVEMAVVDEFDFEKEHYVVGAVIEGDTINEDGRYIYRSVMNGEDFTVEKIKREFDYRRIAEAYLNMEDGEEDSEE
ncbi:MAG: DUF1292 domain-containing protein [Lachnospiraceae bacterium]|nr:DUF1292 domain-containing protein [Lachnospiraceae bacterium]